MMDRTANLLALEQHGQLSGGSEMKAKPLIAGGVIAAGAVVAARETLRRARRIDFKGRVILITGGTRGLGLTLARTLLGEGARVAVCARDEGELDAVRSDLGGSGEFVAVRCDVSDRQQVAQMVGEVRRQLGPIDVLINNAGVIQVGPLEAQTIEDFDEAMDIMYWGVVHTTLEVLSEMRSRGSGSIANITSIGGKVAVPHLAPYVAAKFAAVGFSEAVTAEEAPNGIRVTTVAPGLMRTGSFLQAWFKGDRQHEYAWFAPSSSLHPITISAEHAARSIVEAIRYGKREVVLSVPAKILALAHGISPSSTTAVMSLADRMLPSSLNRERRKGEVAREELGSKTVDRLSRSGLKAAADLQSASDEK